MPRQSVGQSPVVRGGYESENLAYSSPRNTQKMSPLCEEKTQNLCLTGYDLLSSAYAR